MGTIFHLHDLSKLFLRAVLGPVLSLRPLLVWIIKHEGPAYTISLFGSQDFFLSKASCQAGVLWKEDQFYLLAVWRQFSDSVSLRHTVQTHGMGTPVPQVILGMVFVKASYQMEIAGCPLLLSQLSKHMSSYCPREFSPPDTD